MKDSQKIKPLPVQVYFLTVFTLTLCGIIISSYLTFSHHRVFTDIEYKSFCAISKTINCDTVSQSSYAFFIGVPTAVWGIFGYMLMLVLLCFSIDTKKKKMRLLATCFMVSFLFSIISLFLGIISSVLIHAYCIMCIASWIVNFSLLFMFWLIRRRYETNNFFQSFKNDILVFKQNRVNTIFIVVLYTIVGACLVGFYPDYWNYSLQSNKKNLPTGVTEQGHPWIGSKTPELTIVEFSDYRCFQCKKMHFFLRSLISKHPDKIRLVHRHFPMDRKFNPGVKDSFHDGAGILALVAISAKETDNFWEANDYLFNYDFSEGAIYLMRIAKALNMDINILKNNVYKQSTKDFLTQDIIFGIKHEFTGTPAFVINDQVYIGQIPSKIIQPFLK